MSRIVCINKSLFWYFCKFIFWYQHRAIDNYRNKICKACHLCSSIAEFISRQRIVSDNQKALFYNLAGDVVRIAPKDSKCYDDAIRHYERCLDFASQIPEMKSRAFESINWIRQEQARIESQVDIITKGQNE